MKHSAKFSAPSVSRPPLPRSASSDAVSCEVKGTQGLGSDFQSKYFERNDEMMKWSPLSIPATAWSSGKDGVSELAAHATFLLRL